MTKFLAILLLITSLAVPAYAGKISNVDHPGVPNCTVSGPNVSNCENLTIQAIYPPNGLGGRKCYTRAGLDGIYGTLDDKTACGNSW